LLHAVHGLRTEWPRTEKSASFRVTKVRRCTCAVAARKPSMMSMLRPAAWPRASTCPQALATKTSTAGMRFSKLSGSCSRSHVSNASGADGAQEDAVFIDMGAATGSRPNPDAHNSISRAFSGRRAIESSEPRKGEAAKKSARLHTRCVLRSDSSADIALQRCDHGA
jgi:hypothetical protein